MAQALEWALESLCKAGSPRSSAVIRRATGCFPIGEAMNKAPTIKMGDRNHHRYDATLIGLVRSGAIYPAKIPHPGQADAAAIAAYQAFDRREPSWLKVEPKPQGAQAEAAANRRAGCGRVSSRASIRLAP